jgi:Fe-S cluster assembly ATP-binding protein
MKKSALLSIKNLYVNTGGKPILRDFNLEILRSEIHAIMGPNGSGKSTLAQVIAGNESFKIASGSIYFDGLDLLAMSPEERACRGIFVGFQYPIEIPGVVNSYFLKTAVNSIRKFQGLDPYDAFDFLSILKTKTQQLGLGFDFLERPLNFGFSGGEKKRNEILQMLVLEPRFAILDEPDSGVDIDAIKIVATGISYLKKMGCTILIITHYHKIFEYVKPEKVHILLNGKIVQSGGVSLTSEIEHRGYHWLEPLPNEPPGSLL